MGRPSFFFFSPASSFLTLGKKISLTPSRTRPPAEKLLDAPPLKSFNSPDHPPYQGLPWELDLEFLFFFFLNLRTDLFSLFHSTFDLPVHYAPFSYFSHTT